MTASATDSPVLADVAARLWPNHAWRAQPILDGISNHNWSVEVDDEAGSRYVVQQLAPDEQAAASGIDREVHFLAHELAVAADVTPAPLAILRDLRVVVTPYIASTAFPAAGTMRDQALTEVAGLLRRVHELEVPAQLGERDGVAELREQLGEFEELAGQVDVPDGFGRVVQHLRAVLERGPAHRRSVIHFDLRDSNVLVGDRMYVIDWEYARVADPVFDLGSFAFHNGLTAQEEHHFVRAYAGSPDEDLLAALQIYRFSACAVEACWALAMTVAPDAPDHFDYRNYLEQMTATAAELVDASGRLQALVTSAR